MDGWMDGWMDPFFFYQNNYIFKKNMIQNKIKIQAYQFVNKDNHCSMACSGVTSQHISSLKTNFCCLLIMK